MKAIFILVSLFFQQILIGQDPLPSWAQGASKNSIIRFVNEVTNKEGQNFVPSQDRIAVFDQDGTLWIEQPIYTEVFFSFDAIKQMVSTHHELQEKEPFKSVLSNGIEALRHLTPQEIVKIIAVTHSGMTVKDFETEVIDWLKIARHPRFKRPFTELIYQPMLEVIQFLQANDFKIYIVSGGGQEFIRAYAEKTYNIPEENIIGSAAKTHFEYQNGKPVLRKLPEVLFIDDKVGKPEAINLIIGKRPIAAFGNSTGDRQMLEWTKGFPHLSLALLVHHDDASREYAYGPNSKIGTFTNELMEEAKKSDWIVVSMKNDWKIIFPWEKSSIEQKELQVQMQ